MANADTPFGARLIGSLSQAMANGEVHAYTVPASDVTALFVGDFVKLTGTLAVNEDNEYHPVVTQAEATDELVGFVVSVKANPDNLNRIYRPASTLATVMVMDAPFARFEIQTSGTGAVGDAGQIVDITVGSGSTSTGVSAMELDQTTVGSGDQLKILDIMRRPDNEVGLNMKWICMINTHSYRVVTGT